MAEDIVVVGAGGFGRETLDVIDAINAESPRPVWHVIGILDDAPVAIQSDRLRARGIEVLGRTSAFPSLAERCCYVVGIGSPFTRARLNMAFEKWGGRAATLVHPRAVIGSHVSIGDGSVVCAGVQISTNVRLGQHVHLNPGAIIGHDAVLGDYVSINPGAIVSGEVIINEEAVVGAGAVVLQNLVVGASALVGASACVTADVQARSTVVGVPAREVRKTRG